MQTFLKKYWISLLGLLFIFMSLAYSLKYATEMNLIERGMMVYFGIAVGTVAIVLGFVLRKRTPGPTAEIFTGVGYAILFTNFYLATVYYNMWNGVFFYGIVGICALTVFLFSIRMGYRATTLLTFISALPAPLLLPVESARIIPLAIFLLLLSAIYFLAGEKKGWIELKFLAFSSVWYVFYFYLPSASPAPQANHFLFASVLIYLSFSILLLYAIALRDVVGKFNFFLLFYNNFLFLGHVPELASAWYMKSVLLGLAGLVNILCAIILHFLYKMSSRPFSLLFVLGAFFLLFSVHFMEISGGLAPLINVGLWTLGIATLILCGKFFKSNAFKIPALVLWFITLLYTALSSGAIFISPAIGVFIPFLNFASILWIALAGLGFLIASKTSFGFFVERPHRWLPKLIIVLSHLTILVLISLQIQKLWLDFQIVRFDYALTITLLWSVYCLFLLLRALAKRNPATRNLALILLMISVTKGVCVDLSDSTTLHKTIFLLVLGLILLIVAGINKRWLSIQSIEA